MDILNDPRDIVESLNSELLTALESEGDDGDVIQLSQLEYHSTGYTEAITFLDFPVWSSEYDEREYSEYIEGTCDRTPSLREHVTAQMRHIVSRLNALAKFGLEDGAQS